MRARVGQTVQPSPEIGARLLQAVVVPVSIGITAAVRAVQAAFLPVTAPQALRLQEGHLRDHVLQVLIG